MLIGRRKQSRLLNSDVSHIFCTLCFLQVSLSSTTNPTPFTDHFRHQLLSGLYLPRNNGYRCNGSNLQRHFFSTALNEALKGKILSSPKMSFFRVNILLFPGCNEIQSLSLCFCFYEYQEDGLILKIVLDSSSSSIHIIYSVTTILT